MNPVTSGTDSENYVVSIVTNVREQPEVMQAGFILTGIIQRLENESSTNAIRMGMRKNGLDNFMTPGKCIWLMR